MISKDLYKKNMKSISIHISISVIKLLLNKSIRLFDNRDSLFKSCSTKSSTCVNEGGVFNGLGLAKIYISSLFD